MAATTPDGAQTRAPEARLADEVRGGVGDLVRLGQLELELARLEAGSAAKRMGVGAGVVTVALLLLYAGAIIALATLPALLGIWWVWPAEAVGLWVLAVLVALLGYRMIRRAINEAKGTFASIKGDLEWLRQLANRR
jgi:hypothetical protein